MRFFDRKKKISVDENLAHDRYFNELREQEFKRLSKKGHVYLDYTGGNLYSQQLLDTHHELLSSHVLGNPHSENPTSLLATKLVREARQKILDFFHAEDYFCVFTQNASGALKIIGECYPFQDDGHFTLLADNHNSVNGIREYCKTRGGSFDYVPIHYEDLQIDAEELEQHLLKHPNKNNKLFAYPAQSNVTGVKHDLSWIEKARNEGWDVLLDAAAFAPTSELNLSRVHPDFVSISFYKIFGYPTGLGCLLVHKSKYSKLKKPWFAGGTVTLAAVKSPNYFLAENHERFENGTVNYLDIPALKTGLEFIENIGMERLSKRVASLSSYLYNNLKDLKHSNGEPQLRIFGPTDHRNMGGTMIMTFLNPDHSPIPFEVIEEKANEKMISIRAGCFCNPGVDEINNCITTEELSRYFTSREKGDYHDMIAYLHKLRGAIRVSMGLATIKADLDAYVSFVKSLKDVTIKPEKI